MVTLEEQQFRVQIKTLLKEVIIELRELNVNLKNINK